MSRLALISDIHGNLLALDAVLDELARQGVEQIVCLGDIAAPGPQPHETIARLRALDCSAVRGNADGWLLDGLPPGRSEETQRIDELVTWARAQLTSEDIAYLALLPATLALTLDRLSLFCFHGSPRSDVDRLLATTPEAELDRLLADTPAEGILAGGHTHLQLLRRYGTRLLLNPGSVGLPLRSLKSSLGAPAVPACAEYAVLEVDDARFAISLARVSIDTAALAAQTDAMPHPTWAADLERRIERWNARQPE